MKWATFDSYSSIFSSSGSGSRAASSSISLLTARYASSTDTTFFIFIKPAVRALREGRFSAWWMKRQQRKWNNDSGSLPCLMTAVRAAISTAWTQTSLSIGLSTQTLSHCRLVLPRSLTISMPCCDLLLQIFKGVSLSLIFQTSPSVPTRRFGFVASEKINENEELSHTSIKVLRGILSSYE